MTDYASRVIDATLEEELGVSFGRYARATILARAIPDVRDGLKPVQRRIVYAMSLAGNTHERRYRKCAKTVGDVMGSFHPHGDSSIYDAMVRLAQDWKMRAPLVDGHGNFGSIDDDPPAAMRYTEARLDEISSELVRDIKKNTVTFQPTFDDSDVEPTVLPARFPNLLVNGTSGVSTGFATEIPPHNLGECIDACVALIDEPETDLEGLMKHVRGPDFPTGGIVMGLEGLREAYMTGKGRVVLRGRTEIEHRKDGGKTIAVAEIPYGVVKSNLVRQIEKLRTAKVIQGVRDVRDESDREGLRIAVDLKRGVDPEPVLAYLLKKTDLQVYRHFQMVAIVNQSPRQLSLKEILEAYIEHQRDVVIRRSRHDLDRAETRLHIVNGLIKAVDVLDEVIRIIRKSKDRAQAHQRLMERLGFTDPQTKEILDLRLHRLTGLQILQLREEKTALEAEIAKLREILEDDFALMECIRLELLEVRRRFANPRRSTIEAEIEELRTKIEVTVTVKPQAVVVGVSRDGYIKRSSRASFEATDTPGAKEGDLVRWVVETNTLHRLVLFSSYGKAFAIPVHQVPEAKWGDAGNALVNVVGIEKDDEVVSAIGVPSFETRDEVLFVTQLGAIKRTPVSEFDVSRGTGVTAMKLADDDEVGHAMRTDGRGDCMLVTREGNGIRFPLSEVPSRGRSAGGVRGIRLNSRDTVVEVLQVPAEETGYVAVITEQGKAKRTPLGEYPRQHRGGRGVRVLRKLKRLPYRVAFGAWWPDDAERSELCFVRGDFETEAPVAVATLAGASRDGTAKQLLELPAEVRLLDGYLMPVGSPPGEEGEPPIATEPSGDAPAPPSEPISLPVIDRGTRGAWATDDADLYLPGLEPAEADEDDDLGA